MQVCPAKLPHKRYTLTITPSVIRLLAYIWRALVGGNAADEQSREVDDKYNAAVSSGKSRKLVAPPAPPVYDDDDDVDPNDVAPAPPAASSGQGYADPYDSGDEDYEAW